MMTAATSLTLLLALAQTPAPAALAAPMSEPVPATVHLAGPVRPARVTLAAPVLEWQGTPADSLHRAGQAALNRGDYQKAVDTYRELRRRFPRSSRAGDGLYWEAFALYRLGGTTNLRTARERLKTQEQDFPRAATRRDAGSLRVRIERDLARVGDSEAQVWLDSQGALAESSADEAVIAGSGTSSSSSFSSAGTEATRAGREAAKIAREDARAARGAARAGRNDDGNDDTAPAGCDQAKYDEQMMAVQALMTMDKERSVPILKKVMARRDACSARLRRQAVFILGQQGGDDGSVAPMMLDVVRNDPDREVRKMALFALGQTGDPAAVPALSEILRTSDDEELQKQALFALGQTSDPRGVGILREFIQRPGISDELVGNAVMWLGQKGGAEASFLRDAYPRLQSHQAKQMVLMTLAQTGDAANARWLMDRVLDRNEDMDTRKSALFFVGTQSSAVDVGQIAGLYSPTLDIEMRKQILFVLSQRREPAAVDKLLDIAKNDPDRDMRKQAVFWLGQSGDPRAADLLEHMLDQ
ncbi:MAG: HEAT repeat domain-containing protein [Gemmatimonadetes bacterium]|nr:HEAT repeat domain-containing protein [Gemmatimonadota bacterium]